MSERFRSIRTPRSQTGAKGALVAACVFALGAALGVFSKWLDSLALDSTIGWHRVLEALDLGNFFSELAPWLLLALVIAVFSPSAPRAALNVFCFFAGMCAAYQVSSVVIAGFDPGGYMLLWYGLTLLSPLAAVLCWYARGSGAVPIVLDIGIIAVFALSCFALGLVYISLKGWLYLLVFVGAVAALYRSPKQLAVSLPAGLLLAFALSPVWPFQ